MSDEIKVEKGTFVHEGSTPVGLPVGTVWRGDGAAATVAVVPAGSKVEGVPATIAPRDGEPGTYDIEMHVPANKTGWTPKFEAGWGRIFGRKTAVGEA